jgi:hypothetical protein
VKDWEKIWDKAFSKGDSIDKIKVDLVDHQNKPFNSIRFIHDDFPGIQIVLYRNDRGAQQQLNRLVEASKTIDTCYKKQFQLKHFLKYCPKDFGLLESLPPPNEQNFSVDGWGLMAWPKIDGKDVCATVQDKRNQAIKECDSDSALKKKWVDFFTDVAEFICQSDDFIVRWKDVIILREKGPVFLLSPVNKVQIFVQDLRNYNIKKLLKMAPCKECRDTIEAIAQHHKVEINL